MVAYMLLKARVIRNFIPIFLLTSFFYTATQGANFGDPCDPTPIYSQSWKYEDFCNNVYLYCDATTRRCQYKGCSNSDYIHGWDLKVHTFPERCNTRAQYCPDDQSQCRPLLPDGAKCEPQRDDECSGSYAMCLNSTCLIKGAPLSGFCGSEVTNYVSYDSSGQQILQTIIRDNCTQGLYCDYTESHTCILAKAVGVSCTQDNECLSDNCVESNNTCGVAADSFHKVSAWVWVVLAISIFLFVVTTLLLLWFLHRYQSKQEHEKARRFFEQAQRFSKLAEDEKLNEKALKSSNSAYHTSGMIYLATPGSMQFNPRKSNGSPSPSASNN
ncbi:hypothetical protein K450DRAFT_247204 [Umbelopsis ramanniana AG]|uniref:Uncharacterized protein n=1 Tax=Umbelopsis ramanniana AG TaxID=1314678 RepID=A0AAD5HDE7_UMBRA|nr:uncharacterized protein K450DRAFT_247204 [Umbelopsis ramanniana AG]KAI8578506.1 hypothetical protein K450DRAFT_247204 [Umbelopsis ramanniana AG]